MIKKIAKNIRDVNPRCVFLLVSNPVDVLTFFFQKETLLPPKKIIGVASSLDSSRFRYLLSKQFNINQGNFSDVWVLGEHGDSMIPIFSRVRLKQKKIFNSLTTAQIYEITDQVRNYWRLLRKYKNRSAYGIAKHTYDIIETIIKNKELFLPASTMLNGEFGESDVCMGVPLKINRNGIKSITEIKLDKSEINALHVSAQTIKNHIHQN